jgi:uncharacterized protein (DUF433 family)
VERRTMTRADVRTTPNYTILEACHYLRIAPSTLKPWVLGRGRSHRLIEAAALRPTLLLSFTNLVEIHVLHAIRHKHGVKSGKVRRALDYVRRRMGVPHPLATQDFKTDGIDLFIENALDELVIASEGGQVALREAFVNHLERVEHDEAGFARRLFPFTRPSHIAQPKMIVIDPRISFGRPVVSGSGIPTSAIVQRYLAGEGYEHLAKDYRLGIDQIQEAVRCEIPVAFA